MIVKLLLLTVALTSVPLSAKDMQIVKPFGKFEWGDGFETTIKKLCKYDFEKITQPVEGTKAEICSIPNLSLEGFKTFATAKGTQSMLTRNKRFFEFEGVKITNSSSTSMYLRAEGFNLAGVSYKITLELGDNNEDRLAGAYISRKDEASIIDQNGEIIYSPLLLGSMILEPHDGNVPIAVKKSLFEKLKTKYQDFPKVKTMGEYDVLYVKGDEGTTLHFDSGPISYESGSLLHKDATTALQKYLADKANKNTKNDASDEL